MFPLGAGVFMMAIQQTVSLILEGQLYVVNTGKRMEDQVLETFDNTDRGRCSALCKSRDNCWSFNVITENGEESCELNGGLELPNIITDSETDLYGKSTTSLCPMDKIYKYD